MIRDVLTPLLIGEDPRLIGRLWHRMFDATHGWGRRGTETYAVSGVDIALWDLLGKACGRPVCELLGAGHRELTAYAAPSLQAPRGGGGRLRAGGGTRLSRGQAARRAG